LSEGVYTIKVAARRAGVTAELLRAWERRYGVPSPQRSASGYRLYSEEDIRTVRWIQEKIAWGFSVRQAVELYKGDRSGLAGDSDLDAVRATLLDHLLAGEGEKTEAVLERAFLRYGVETICVGVVQPLLAWVGEMWHQGEIGVAHEHWVSELLRSVLTRLLAEEKKATQEGEGVRVVVGCAPDEMHEIGALTLALFLARRRLDVLYLGRALPLEDLRGFTQGLGVEAVFLSVAQEAQAKQVLAVLSEFEAKSRARVFVGGLAFQSEALRGAAGEYFLSLDAREAADIAAQLLLRQERSPE
jgi:MerR family transcriptional regulator, light-induced transcriptional regulator